MNGEPSVSVKNLTIRFGDFTAVDDISFSVFAGEIFGFLGANGAGKTTTIRALCGLLTPNSGAISVAGAAPEQPEQLKSRIGYMSQRFTLYPDLTVDENLAFAGALRKMPPEQARARGEELLSFTGFSFGRSKLVRELPGGARQQVALAAAVMHDPQVLFLDEPTAGVSAQARAQFWTLIREMARRGKTVFVTTHYMDEAEECARIALINTGRIIALDSPANLKKSAFPAPLYEVSGADFDLAAEMARLKAGTAEPFGLKWRIELRDAAAWERLSSERKLSP
ncbi:MAG TPA: ABC transporter ATP-binding protein, partial [Elusimicrobiales bacterium]|nr:ABC transporter ATP-binding protein [Elusimicrobiales bacterium]